MGFYAGIGSRETPAEVLELMRRMAARLELRGFILRSGGALGADSAFAEGTTQKEVYLPWKGFNDIQSSMPLPSKAAFDLAATLHPAWEKLSQAARKLMARNCYQILGADLNTPVSFVVCWTQDGAESEAQRSSKTGGTGQAIALASRRNIQVINLKNHDAMERLHGIVVGPATP